MHRSHSLFYSSVAVGTTRLDSPITVLALPGRLEALPPEWVESDDGNPDVVALTEVNAAVLVPSRLRPALAAILPIVDVSGRIERRSQFRRADFIPGASGRNSLADAAKMLHPIIQRVHGLPSSTLETTDPRIILLARLHVRERGMEPRRDPSVKETVSYDDEIAVPGAHALAEQLVGLGLMERRFVDMRSVCSYCASARLSVRERCISCGSADVHDHTVLHHMRCGYQGPEEDFFDPGKEGVLRCPKCTRRLEEFSIDYDRPGMICVCRACGRASGDTTVEFGCLDCDADIASANIDTRSVYAYFLTASGRACVTSGSPGILAALEPERMAATSIRNFIAHQANLRHQSCILCVRLQEPQGVPSRGRSWQQSRSFFADILRECFTTEVEIVATPSTFFILISRDSKHDVESALPEIRHRLERHLAVKPTMEFAIFALDEALALVSSRDVHH
jgi:hypothetical protein